MAKKNKNTTNLSFCQLELTTDCNMKCASCLFWQGTSEQPNIEIVLRSVDDLAAAGVTNLEIIGGEPLMYEHLLSLLRYLNEKKEIRRFAVITNATMVDRLLEIKPQLSFEKGGLVVSINYTEKQCVKLMQSGIDEAMAKKSLAGWRVLREFGGHCHIRVNCVINSLNVSTLPEIARQVINMGGSFSFCPLIYRRQKYDSGINFTFRSRVVGLALTEKHKEAARKSMTQMAILKQRYKRDIIPTVEYMEIIVLACKNPNEPYQAGCKGKGVPYLRVGSKARKSLRDGKISLGLKACSDIEGPEFSRLVVSDLRYPDIIRKLSLIYQNDPDVIKCNREERCVWSVTHILSQRKHKL